MTTHRESVDLVVVGLGAMGAAVAYHARLQGLAVVGLDRHSPPHQFGSTQAETRITRLAVGEGPQYLPFVRRSHELWRELEATTGADLLFETGGLIVTEQEPVEGQRWEDFVTATQRVAAEAQVDFHLPAPHEVTRLCPMLRGFEDKRVGYEPSAGLVMAERAVRIQLEQAAAAGADIRTDETVLKVSPTVNGVDVVSDKCSYSADRVVLAAGPWLHELLPQPQASLLSVTRQVVYWFEVDNLATTSTDAMPFVMWVGDTDEQYVGIFPTPPGGTPGLKILGEQFLEDTDPHSVDRSVSTDEIERFYEQLVKPKFDGVHPRCVKTAVCLYTNTPDDHFIIDHALDSDRITMMSPCSGHGFKHSAALGEAVAQQITTGTSTLDLSPFKLERLAAR